MKWATGFKKQWNPGDRRTRRVFLFFPLKLGGDSAWGEPYYITKWLQFAWIIDEYVEAVPVSMEEDFHAYWRPVAWCDEDTVKELEAGRKAAKSE